MKYQNLKLFQKYLETSHPGDRSSVYLVAIPDDFERKRCVDFVLSLVLSPDQPCIRWSAADATLSELFTEIDSLSLFAAKPVTFIDEVEKLSKKQAQGFLDILNRGDFQGHLIFGSRGKSLLYSAVEKQGVVIDLSEEKPWDKDKRLAEQIFHKVGQTGKSLSSEAFQLLFERVDKNVSLLEQEIDKLICFTAEKNSIELSDVLQISVAARSQTVWQIAEEIVWEGRYSEPIDEDAFHGLLPALPHQLQMGLKMVSLLESRAKISEITRRLPKIWPKVLEKRLSQAPRLGAVYFQRGLEYLFRVELLSRSSSINTLALLDWFRCCFARLMKI